MTVAKFLGCTLFETLASQLKQATYEVTAETARFRRRVNRDWFDDDDSEANTLLDDTHQKHITWIKDKNSTTKKQLYHSTNKPGKELNANYARGRTTGGMI